MKLDYTRVERAVSMPVVNPETGRASRSFVFMGVLDLEEGDRIVEYKGTSRPDRFITRLAIGYQAELYALARQHEGSKVLEIEYRIIARPSLRYSRPKYRYAVTKPDRKTAIRVLDDPAEAEALAKMRGAEVEERVTGDVTRDDYEQRCFKWLLGESDHIRSHPYFVNPAKLRQAAWFVWECSKRILDSRLNRRWIPNVGACFAYDRPCMFQPLCEAVLHGTDVDWTCNEQFQQIESSHPELKGADKNRAVLTHSSLADLTLCEMLYYWQHELRLRKRVDEDSEPLWVGSAMHVGVATYTTAGEEAALTAIDKWAEANPVLGPDASWRQDEQIARARAMVRAAAAKWSSLQPQSVPDDSEGPKSPPTAESAVGNAPASPAASEGPIGLASVLYQAIKEAYDRLTEAKRFKIRQDLNMSTIKTVATWNKADAMKALAAIEMKLAETKPAT